MLGPFFFFRRTERPDQTGTNKVLFHGDIPHCRRRWTLIAHQHAVVVSWHAQKWLTRPKILDGPKHVFLPGTERTAEQPRSVPFGSTRFYRVKRRPHYCCRDHYCLRHVLLLCRLIAYPLAAEPLTSVKDTTLTSATTTVGVKSSCYVFPTNCKQHVLIAATVCCTHYSSAGEGYYCEY